MEFVVVWFILALLVGWWASEWGRSGVGYFFLTFFGSPILGGIVLLIVGNKRAREAAEESKRAEQRREHERQLESLRVIAGTAAAKPAAGVPASTKSVADELQKLAALRERGLLTDAELAEQKRRLLAS